MTLGPLYYACCRTQLGHATARLALTALRRLGLMRNFHMPFDALTVNHAAAAALMRLWSRIHWSSGDGMMPPDQLLALYRLAAAWPVAGDTVELGSWVGLTTSYLATAAGVQGTGQVYAVDTFAGTREGDTHYPSVARFGGSTRRAFDDQLARAGVADRVTPLTGFTTQVASDYPGRPIRFLLIDADHSYEGVRADFEAWAPHVAAGGLIVFHDHLLPDIARFIRDDVAAQSDYALIPGEVVPNVFAVTKLAGAPRNASAPHHQPVELARHREFAQVT